MTTHHLNPLQRELLQRWLRDNPTRPESEAYIKASAAMARIPVSRKPTPREIPFTAAGFNKGELQPTKVFSAVRDMPAGWGIHPCYDSGSNWRIVNAGVSLMAAVYNGWNTALAPLPTNSNGRTAHQLKANKIQIP